MSYRKGTSKDPNTICLPCTKITDTKTFRRNFDALNNTEYRANVMYYRDANIIQEHRGKSAVLVLEKKEGKINFKSARVKLIEIKPTNDITNHNVYTFPKFNTRRECDIRNELNSNPRFTNKGNSLNGVNYPMNAYLIGTPNTNFYPSMISLFHIPDSDEIFPITVPKKEYLLESNNVSSYVNVLAYGRQTVKPVQFGKYKTIAIDTEATFNSLIPVVPSNSGTLDIDQNDTISYTKTAQEGVTKFISYKGLSGLSIKNLPVPTGGNETPTPLHYKIVVSFRIVLQFLTYEGFLGYSSVINNTKDFLYNPDVESYEENEREFKFKVEKNKVSTIVDLVEYDWVGSPPPINFRSRLRSLENKEIGNYEILDVDMHLNIVTPKPIV